MTICRGPGDHRSRYSNSARLRLYVTSRPKRLENLRAEAEAVNGGRVFWFTTVEQSGFAE